MVPSFHPTDYREPQITLERPEPTDSRQGLVQTSIIPLIIGPSLGKLSTIYNEAVTRGAGSTDALDNDEVESVMFLGDEYSMSTYTENVDFEIDINDDVEWLDNTASPPVGSASSDHSSGSLAADTYYYKITGTNDHGETTGSEEFSATLVSSGRIVVTWTGVDEKITGFKLYRSTTSGSFDDTLLTTISVAGQRIYYDDGTDSPGSGTPPVVNGCLRKPVEDDTYYISYKYRDYSDMGEINRYYNPADAYADHDKDSDIGIAIDLAMGPFPEGQGCGHLMVIGLNPTDVAGAGESGEYATALTKAEEISEVVNIVPLSYNDGVSQAVANHCRQMNDKEIVKPRICTLSGSADEYGPADTVGTVMAKIASLSPTTEGGELIRYVGNGGVQYKKQNDVGGYSWVEKPAWPLAVCYAAMRGASVDPSEGISQRAIGYSKLRLMSTKGLNFNNRVQREYVGSVGGLVFANATTATLNGIPEILLIDDQTVYTISAYYNESPIVEVDILMARQIWLNMYNSGVLGKKLTESRKFQIKQIIQNVQRQFKSKEWISGIGSVTTSASATDPNRRVNVVYTWKPYFCVKGIDITRQFVYTT
jgi:hypothetical protein